MRSFVDLENTGEVLFGASSANDADAWESYSFVMTDIVASTQRWEADVAGMAADLQTHNGVVQSALIASGGRLVNPTGDGFVFVFDSPSAAIIAATDTQASLARTQWRGSPLKVRIGISFGPAQRRGNDYFGPTLNRCARVMASGCGGQIFASDEVIEGADMAPPRGYSLYDHGRCRLKDLEDSLRIWELVGHDQKPNSPLTLDTVSHNLPEDLTAFVGRQRDLSALSDSLVENRFITLVGPGGIGKSRLARQLASAHLDHFSDGIWMVRCEVTNDPDLVADLAARSMDVRPVEGLRTTDRLVNALRGRRVLMIFDCCEHVLDGVRPLICELLASDLNVTVLATSRTPIEISGERLWRLPPLEAPVPSSIDDGAGEELSPSARLFVERAADRLSAAQLSQPEQLRAIHEIVYRLDGLPLAIELAAARVGALDPKSLSARLDEIGNRAGHVDRAARHQSLEATIEWSDRLLSRPAQCLLRRLTVFSAPPDLLAAEAVCSPNLGSEVADLVDELANASLVSVQLGLDGVNRFRTSDSVLAYAAARWDAEDQMLIRDSHADWVLASAKKLGPLVSIDAAAVRTLSAVQPDLDTGFAWLFSQDRHLDAAEVAAGLAVFWVLTGQAVTGRRLLEQSLAADFGGDLAREAATLEGAGIAAALDADYERSDELLASSAIVFRDLERVRRAAYPEFWRARSRIVLAFYGRSTGDGLRTATKLLEHCLSVFREHGDLFGTVLSLPYLSWARMMQASSAAREPLEESLVLSQTPGLELVAAYAKAHLAHHVLVVDDDDVEAKTLLSESISVLRSAGDQQNVLICQLLMVAIELRQGQSDSAERAVAEAARIASAGGSREWELAVVSMALAVKVARRDMGTASEIHGLLSIHLPTWSTVLANAGHAPLLPDLDRVLNAVPANVRRTAGRSGARRSVIETIEALAGTGR